jgi:hypothetical protein
MILVTLTPKGKIRDEKEREREREEGKWVFLFPRGLLDLAKQRKPCEKT